MRSGTRPGRRANWEAPDRRGSACPAGDPGGGMCGQHRAGGTGEHGSLTSTKALLLPFHTLPVTIRDILVCHGFVTRDIP